MWISLISYGFLSPQPWRIGSVCVFTSNVKSPPLFSWKSEILPSQLESCCSPDIYFLLPALSHSSKWLLHSSAADLCTVNESPLNPLPSLPLPMCTWNAWASYPELTALMDCCPQRPSTDSEHRHLRHSFLIWVAPALCFWAGARSALSKEGQDNTNQATFFWFMKLSEKLSKSPKVGLSKHQLQMS